MGAISFTTTSASNNVILQFLSVVTANNNIINLLKEEKNIIQGDAISMNVSNFWHLLLFLDLACLESIGSIPHFEKNVVVTRLYVNNSYKYFCAKLIFPK